MTDLFVMFAKYRGYCRQVKKYFDIFHKKNLSVVYSFLLESNSSNLSTGQAVVHYLLPAVVKIIYNFKDSFNHAMA